MKTSIKIQFANLFRNTGFILALAIVMGLAFYQGASWTKPAVTPILGLIMTLSLLGVSSKIFWDFRKLLIPISISLVLNYLLLSGSLIGLSSLILTDHELWIGFVLVAAVPAAVGVIPFSHHLGANTELSLVGTAATYLAAFVITPLISITLLGVNIIAPERLLLILVELIIGPFILSRVLQRTRISTTLEKFRGAIVNWSFFLVIYTVIGLNRDAFLTEPVILLRLAIVAFVSTFVITYLIDRLLKFLGVDKPKRISLALLGTRKNYGLAAAIALTFFNSRTAAPSAVASAFAIIHFIWLTFRVKKMD